MKVYKNIKELLTLEGVHKKDGRLLQPDDLGIIENASVVFDENQIIWVGKTVDLPDDYSKITSEDFSGKVVLPEIVDSHTHLVFGGNRANEYSMRLNGADYQEIANAGGGILSTMESTNKASFEELYSLGKKRIETISSYGIRSIEVKSGYSLTYENEKILSEVIHKLKQDFSDKVHIHNTFLAAHAVPKTYSTSSKYLKEVVLPLLHDVKNIIDSVDIFQEEGYFDSNDVEELFSTAQDLNIQRRIHADEFNDNNGAYLATKYNCLSADHLLRTSKSGIKALAGSNTVATILPGTALFLGKPLANARAFLDEGCKVAIASDYNPVLSL